jgi:N-acetylglucosaminyldiphosphoundecaprenol N-acetyl-beta-D-mannosaminyltransferase
MRKITVVSADVSVTSYDEVVDTVGRWIVSNTADPPSAARYVCVTSVHGIVTARHDPDFRRILNEADVVTPDGMPVVWALRSFGAPEQQRVYGPTLMLRLCLAADRKGHRVFLYGGRPEVLPALSKELKGRFPGLLIAGTFSPPFRALTLADEHDVIRRIRDSGADLVFVGISTPKQEKWMAAHRQHFPGKVLVGVGAAFDMHAKRVKQAPAWMQAVGLEWFFRLITEPARLWKRYLLVTPQFLPLWALQKFAGVKYQDPPARA